MSWPQHLGEPRARDWPEDAEDADNGCYGHVCACCLASFIGHKRRPPQCKVCAAEAKAKWDAMTPEQQAEQTRVTAELIAKYIASL
jgi:hypothetical protein